MLAVIPTSTPVSHFHACGECSPTMAGQRYPWLSTLPFSSRTFLKIWACQSKQIIMIWHSQGEHSHLPSFCASSLTVLNQTFGIHHSIIYYSFPQLVVLQILWPGKPLDVSASIQAAVVPLEGSRLGKGFQFQSMGVPASHSHKLLNIPSRN